VQSDQHQQPDAHGPEQFHIGLEKMPVAIDRLRSEKDLEVAHQMSDDEQKKENAAGGHDKLLAERRFEKAGVTAHQTLTD